jgi:hypothetical protein
MVILYIETEPPLVPSGPLMVIVLELLKVLVLPAQLPAVDQLPKAKLPEKSARALSGGATTVIADESNELIRKQTKNLFLITSNYTRKCFTYFGLVKQFKSTTKQVGLCDCRATAENEVTKMPFNLLFASFVPPVVSDQV